MARWLHPGRPGARLRELDRTCPAAGQGMLVPGPDGLMWNEITIELVFDPPGHVRLPINDDEIIDRALAIEPVADRKVTLLTYDTGQSMRARSVGLQVIKLSKKAEEQSE